MLNIVWNVISLHNMMVIIQHVLHIIKVASRTPIFTRLLSGKSLISATCFGNINNIPVYLLLI